MADHTNPKNFRKEDKEIYPTLSCAVKARMPEYGEIISTNEPPPKKTKISTNVLRNISKDVKGSHTVGRIVNLPKCSSNIVQDGHIQVKELFCTAVENRVGRVNCDEQKKKGIRFVYIADFTSFMSIGMPGKDSGAYEFDLSEDECKKGGYCVFTLSLSGKIAWRPSSYASSTPTFFLNNGVVKKIDISCWDVNIARGLPTSDVLRRLSFSRFSSSSSYGTTGICRKIDNAVEKENKLVLSVEDPVRFTAMSLAFEENEGLELSKTRTLCEVGSYIFIFGIFEVQSLPSTENAVLFGRSSKVTVKSVEKEQYTSYVEMMMNTPGNLFVGVRPEKM
ncbi:hypothetical protein FGB62_169g11 [Gracilaria domingensis]|nr:hypothetical protein FGB62_169g11 [Gracilaria domingensis]